MSASDKNAEILGSLGRGDAVAAVEAAKDAAYALAQAIEAQADEQSPEQVFNRADEPAEELLAVLYPLIEHGSERATEVLPRALVHVAHHTSAALPETTAHRVGGTVVLGRLVWATVAYAIHCGRFDAVAEASRATVPVPFTDGAVAAVIALQTLRYPDALGGNAGNSYNNYRDSLLARPLINNRYPLFAGEAEEAIAEADGGTSPAASATASCWHSCSRNSAAACTRVATIETRSHGSPVAYATGSTGRRSPRSSAHPTPTSKRRSRTPTRASRRITAAGRARPPRSSTAATSPRRPDALSAPGLSTSQFRGSFSSARSPASSIFSTTQ